MLRITFAKLASVSLVCLALIEAQPRARADVISNQEPNDSFATAQVIPPEAFAREFNPFIVISDANGGYVNNSLTSDHVTILRPGTNQSTANLDYFRFRTAVFGPIVADIDNTPEATNFDTKIYLFRADGLLLAENDDVSDLTPGDDPFGLIGGILNSRIETGILPPGEYIVAVSESPSFGSDGGLVEGSIFGGGPVPAFGSYTLNISIPIPEPATLSILGMGLPGLIAYSLGARWRKRRTG